MEPFFEKVVKGSYVRLGIGVNKQGRMCPAYAKSWEWTTGTHPAVRPLCPQPCVSQALCSLLADVIGKYPHS